MLQQIRYGPKSAAFIIKQNEQKYQHHILKDTGYKRIKLGALGTITGYPLGIPHN
jgi:hypothetical protein